MFLRSLILPIVLCFFSLTLKAYIPSADFIASKVTKNAGSGFYQVRQDVVFTSQARPITVSETWWIQNDDVMFLKVESPLFTQYFLYKNGKKYFFEDSGSVMAVGLAPDFYMNIYFQRSSVELKESLVQRKILPATTFKKRPFVKTTKDAQLVAQANEPYLKLSRVKNTVSYLLGFAAVDEEQAGIWIEQDRFAIKKIRFNSQAEVTSETHLELSRNLLYPKATLITWPGNNVQVETSRVDALNSGTSFFNEAEFAKLSAQSKGIPSDLTSVVEFYKRFR